MDLKKATPIVDASLTYPPILSTGTSNALMGNQNGSRVLVSAAAHCVSSQTHWKEFRV